MGIRGQVLAIVGTRGQVLAPVGISGQVLAPQGTRGLLLVLMVLALFVNRGQVLAPKAQEEGQVPATVLEPAETAGQFLSLVEIWRSSFYYSRTGTCEDYSMRHRWTGGL